MTPSLPYFLGCPSWRDDNWRDAFYPADARSAEYLGLYTQVFNAVEGNTTHYARPKPATVQSWADAMPAGFRFTAKFPSDISHDGDLRLNIPAAEEFMRLLAPLGERVTPWWLQLSRAFTPDRLGELAMFIDTLQVPMAVEVRHRAFFEKGEQERALNRLLLDRGVERVCLDSRPLFSCVSSDPAVLHAQSKKPRLPVRPAALTQFPQVRFIGGPDLAANETFLLQWVEKVAQWIEEGRTPYVFLHTPDNHLAPAQAQRFHELLMARLPGLPPLCELDRGPQVEQLGLL